MPTGDRRAINQAAAEATGEARASLAACVLHDYHSPLPEYTELHHVFPVGWGGPEKGTLAACCPTGHRNVHVLLAIYRRQAAQGIAMSWDVLRHFGPGERQMAKRGWDAFVAAQGAS